ncbi:MAG: ATP-dependent helicase HrpB, partial [Hyphomicrobiales bacterium]|nr:ATP-dependent helicase HrpB [Hyphomicrobiales bacterium]
MSAPQDSHLPIDAVLGDISAGLAANPALVVVAPPGAGKTTRVPLHLLDAAWLAGRRIILLEPRRLAARAAAERMAATLGEAVGGRIGLRMRMQTLVSAKTRIEVVTEGVFARMIVGDPMLEGIGLVIFDEFHERSLDADLALALTLDSQRGLREDLRLLVMSATLDGARVSALLGHGPVVESLGRSYAVTTHYLGRNPQARIEDEMTRAITRALRAGPGSLLAFLPGQAEITRTALLLAEALRDEPVEIAPLYGALERAAQDAALRPAAPGKRKVVLATSIAETSLTLPDISLVVDSGLARVPRFEPGLGLSHFVTQRVSQASADQRRGRAGRLGPGQCFRLWEEAAHAGLQPFATPEILSADLSGLVLDLAQWGVADAATLAWLDPPPAPALSEARKLLRALGALDEDGRMTAAGEAMRALPVHPRLARMVIGARASGEAQLAAELAALLMERGLGGQDVDLAHRIEQLARDGAPRGRAARQWARRLAGGGENAAPDPARSGALLALAYPDRIARARGKPGEFVMRNGRAAAVEPHLALARAPFA